MMWWLTTIGWQNNLCVFDNGWWIVSGAFGWLNNCFQSSLWSNSASSTQKLYLPLRIGCPPPLKRFLGQMDRPNYFFPERDVEEQRWFGWSDWLHVHTPECVFYVLYVYAWTHTCLCLCVCVHLRVCVFSQLGLISEQENHSEWFRGNCPQLQSQTHVVSQKSDRVRFTFQTSTSDRIQTIWKLCRNGPVVTHTCMQGLKASPWF